MEQSIQEVLTKHGMTSRAWNAHIKQIETGGNVSNWANIAVRLTETVQKLTEQLDQTERLHDSQVGDLKEKLRLVQEERTHANGRVGQLICAVTDLAEKIN